MQIALVPRSLIRKARKVVSFGDAIESYLGNTCGDCAIVEGPSSSTCGEIASKAREYRDRSRWWWWWWETAVTAVAAAETRRQSSSAAPRRARPWSARTHAQSERASWATYLDHKRDHRLFSFTHAWARLSRLGPR